LFICLLVCLLYRRIDPDTKELPAWSSTTTTAQNQAIINPNEGDDDDSDTVALLHEENQNTTIQGNSGLNSSVFRKRQASESQKLLRAASIAHPVTSIYESSNLDRTENEISRDHAASEPRSRRYKYYGLRWLCVACVGVVAGVIAFLLHEGMIWGKNFSWWLISLVGYETVNDEVLCGMIFVLIGSMYGVIAGLVIFILDPTLRGATTEVLVFLNGIVVDKTLQLKNLFSHSVSLMFVTASPMCVGKEGPMLSIGSQIGNAFAKLGRFDEYDTRDLVATGLGAGVAAAFGAPAGAVLFTLEKASHFTAGLMTRLLFCCMLTCFVLSFLITGIDGNSFRPPN